MVLYFFPKAFTKGCTLEARAFSEANAEFKKAGAQVIGLSADDYPTLRKFSVEECRSAFPVATATKAIIKGYDVSMPVAGKVIDHDQPNQLCDRAQRQGGNGPFRTWTGASMSPRASPQCACSSDRAISADFRRSGLTIPLHRLVGSAHR